MQIENKITIVIPTVDNLDLLHECIAALKYRSRVSKIIVVDNGSNPPILENVWVWRNEENQGCLPALRKVLPHIETELVAFMHNDVLIHETAWDIVVWDAFRDRPNLGLAGFFGAKGVAPNGGRVGSKSRMIGKRWGTAWNLHGGFLEKDEVMPSTVLDSLCMIFRTEYLQKLGIPEEWPPHHWFDRLFGVQFIKAGYDVATIGIDFDHRGGSSSGLIYDEFVMKWAKENNIETDGKMQVADIEMYNRGLKLFMDEYNKRAPLLVDNNWNYSWRNFD